MGKPPPSLVKVSLLQERWKGIMQDYRRRHRTWVMTFMPSMSADQWEAYQQWVTEFGIETLKQTGRHKRKVRGQLRTAKKQAVLPIQVHSWHTLKSEMRKRMRFAMDMSPVNVPGVPTAKVTRRAPRR